MDPHQLFLVTAIPGEEHLVSRALYTYVPLDLEEKFRETTTELVSVVRDNSYIPRIITREIGTHLFVYGSNLGATRNLFDKLDPVGIIIPVGHGDINSVTGMGFENADKVGVPVFEAYKHYPGYRGYEGRLLDFKIRDMTSAQRERAVEEAFTFWLYWNYKRK